MQRGKVFIFFNTHLAKVEIDALAGRRQAHNRIQIELRQRGTAQVA